jgi:hypothetical protein
MYVELYGHIIALSCKRSPCAVGASGHDLEGQFLLTNTRQVGSSFDFLENKRTSMKAMSIAAKVEYMPTQES